MAAGYDYVIVGAGPAGCVCAAELVKKGYSVCVFEKYEKGHRKVCGDGISHVCLNTLRSIDFPVEKFMEAGAVKIKKYIHYLEGRKYVDELETHKKEALGLARNKTDLVFQNYITDQYKVPVFYRTEVTDIHTLGDGYMVRDVYARRLVIASGTGAVIRLDGHTVTRPNTHLPFGISTIVRAKECSEPFFLFDYDTDYHGTYAWIFCIGKNEYNIGLWLKSDVKQLKSKLSAFMATRVREYLGEEIQIMRRPRGAWMGIGERVRNVHTSIDLIGDAAYTSNPADGEGISLAVKDAAAYAEQVKDREQLFCEGGSAWE